MTIYFFLILGIILIILVLYLILLFSTRDENNEFSIIEISPGKTEENIVLLNKMALLIRNLRSIPQEKSICSIIFDITAVDNNGLRTFRVIASKEYQDNILGILKSNFPDFLITCKETISEELFFKSYKSFFVFTADSNRPIMKNSIHNQESMIENVKTIVNSVGIGSFQIMLKFWQSDSSLLDEKSLDEIQIGNTQVSDINYIKNIEISCRFLGFDEEISNMAALPSSCGGILNLSNKFNRITKSYNKWVYKATHYWVQNFIINILYYLHHWMEPRLQYFSGADSLWLSTKELTYLYSFIYASNVDTLPYKMCNPRKILAKQKELEAIYSSNEFTNVALIDHPSCEEKTYFKVDNKTRLKHTYVIGKTGSGKTTVMLNLMKNDIESGKSFALFDPHGDLSNELLNLVPDFRQKDVVYIDPSHFLWFGNINLSVFSFLREIQECQKVEEDLLHNFQTWWEVKMNHTDALMSMIVTILKDVSIWWKEHWWSRMEALLMNIGSELFKYNLSEISDFSAFLNNASFRKTIISQMSDPALQEEFRNLEARWEKIRDEYFQPLKSRFRIFMSKSMWKIFSGTPKMKLRDMMDTGNILIFRLPNGHLWEEANTLGAIMIGLFWAMAQSRISTEEKERKIFTVYIDEVQKFMTSSFCSILEESRKYGLNLVMANQYLKQVSDRNPAIYNSIHGNVWTFISFGVGIDDWGRLCEKFGLSAVDMTNIPPHHAYVQCNNSDETFSIKTEVVERNPKYTYPGKDNIIRQSYLKYWIDTLKAEKIKHFSERKVVLYQYLVHHPEWSFGEFMFEFNYNKTVIDKLLEALQQSKAIQISDDKYSADIEIINEYLNQNDNYMEMLEFDHIFTETILKDSISLKWYYDRYGTLPEYGYTKENYRYELLTNENKGWTSWNINPNIIIQGDEITWVDNIPPPWVDE